MYTIDKAIPLKFSAEEMKEIEDHISKMTEKDLWGAREFYVDVLSHCPDLLRSVLKLLAKRSSELLASSGICFVKMPLDQI